MTPARPGMPRPRLRAQGGVVMPRTAAPATQPDVPLGFAGQQLPTGS